MELTGTGFYAPDPGCLLCLELQPKARKVCVFSREGCVCVSVCFGQGEKRGNEKQINSNLAYKKNHGEENKYENVNKTNNKDESRTECVCKIF